MVPAAPIVYVPEKVGEASAGDVSVGDVSVGDVSVLFVSVSTPARVASVPEVGSVSVVGAVVVSVRESDPPFVNDPESTNCADVTVKPVAPPFITTTLFAFPDNEGSLSNAD